VTNDITKTSIKNRIYQYITPWETVICDSDGVTGDHTSHQESNTNLFNEMLAT
jgi:hypothetical protein